jgi:hypothetical protein
MMKKFVLLTGLTAIFFAANATAEGIDIDPGNWEMTSSMAMTMTGMSIPPQTFTVTECIEEEELDPEHFNMDQENPCDISNVAIDDNTAKWSISCPTDMGSMQGQWEFTSNGDSISGNGMMNADYGGQKMGFEMTWQGKRTGDCEE